jgi:hypothetical protein
MSSVWMNWILPEDRCSYFYLFVSQTDHKTPLSYLRKSTVLRFAMAGYLFVAGRYAIALIEESQREMTYRAIVMAF